MEAAKAKTRFQRVVFWIILVIAILGVLFHGYILVAALCVVTEFCASIFHTIGPRTRFLVFAPTLILIPLSFYLVEKRTPWALLTIFVYVLLSLFISTQPTEITYFIESNDFYLEQFSERVHR